MSTSYSVFGANSKQEERKKQAQDTIKTLTNLKIEIPSKLYDIVEEDNIKLKVHEVSTNHAYQQHILISELPENVDTIIFQIS